MHTVSCFHTFWGSSGILLTSESGIRTLNFTEMAGYRNFSSVQV